MNDHVNAVGARAPRLEAQDKVAGLARYTDDLYAPNMLHGALLGSPHAHAAIVSCDVSAARALPGVKAVLTGEDFPHRYGSFVKDETPLARDETIFIGGPVQGPLAVLHDQIDLAEQPLMDGLHLSMKRENLNRLLADKSANMRVFSGYSGWGPGQLDREMDIGSWHVVVASDEYVFAEDPRALWKQLSPPREHRAALHTMAIGTSGADRAHRQR